MGYEIISVSYWIIMNFRDFFPSTISIVEHKSSYIIFYKLIKREELFLLNEGSCIGKKIAITNSPNSLFALI
jgi:hypothetical protein